MRLQRRGPRLQGCAQACSYNVGQVPKPGLFCSTDLMTEMTDLTSDLLGSGIPFLDYKVYAERVFFPGHQESPLHRDLGVPESRRPTVEQGLGQLSNLLNSKLFLTKVQVPPLTLPHAWALLSPAPSPSFGFGIGPSLPPILSLWHQFIHTLESQRTFSARDRAYVASLLTVALHGKLEYFTDILRTLLSDLVAQYVAKNPKLMLRRSVWVSEAMGAGWLWTAGDRSGVRTSGAWRSAE